MGHMDDSEEPQLRVEDFTEIITKQEIEDLEDRISKQKELLDAISKALEKETKNQESAEKDYDESKRERINVIEEKDVKDRQFKQVSSRVRQLEFEIQEGEKALEAANKELKDSEQGLTDAKDIFDKSRDEYKENKERVDDLSTQYQEIDGDYNKMLADLAEKKDQLAGAEPGSEEEKELTDVIAKLEKEIADTGEKRGKVKQMLDEATERVAELEEVLPGLEAAVPKAEDRLAAAHQGMEEADKKMNQLQEAFSDERSVADDLERNIEDLRNIIEEVTKDSEEKFANLVETNEAVARVTSDYDKAKAELIRLQSGEIEAAYQEQQASRAEFVEETVSSTKIDAVLFDRVSPYENEAVERDRETIKQAIYEALEVEEKGDNTIQQAVEQAKSREGMLSAEKALELTRQSIFSVEKIMEEIVETAKAGKTSIVKKSNEITAPTILTLIELRYNVTHKKVAKVGRNAATIEFTISWAAVGGSK